MPIQSRIWLAVRLGKSRFFGLSGSIAGAIVSHASDGQVRRHELGHREHGRVEVRQKRPQKAPGVGVGLGGVDVTAPHPAGASLAVQAQQRGRLGVVHDDEVIGVVEQRRVLARAVQVGRPLEIGQRLG